jgi:hypothetical protein
VLLASELALHGKDPDNSTDPVFIQETKLMVATSFHNCSIRYVNRACNSAAHELAKFWSYSEFNSSCDLVSDVPACIAGIVTGEMPDNIHSLMVVPDHFKKQKFLHNAQTSKLADYFGAFGQDP